MSKSFEIIFYHILYKWHYFSQNFSQYFFFLFPATVIPSNSSTEPLIYIIVSSVISVIVIIIIGGIVYFLFRRSSKFNFLYNHWNKFISIYLRLLLKSLIITTIFLSSMFNTCLICYQFLNKLLIPLFQKLLIWPLIVEQK